jgi:hypothetical protein
MKTITTIMAAMGMFTICLTAFMFLLFLLARFFHAIGILRDGEHKTTIGRILSNFN